MSEVFLSYSRSDADAMLRLRDELRSANISVWTDDVGLEPGTPQWMGALEDALEGADCLVVILSPEAKGSIWVGREVRYAEVTGIRIFPVLVRGDTLDAVSINLINVQRVDLRRNYKDGVARLISVIDKHIRQIRTETEPVSREPAPLDEQQLDEDIQRKLSDLYTSGLSAFWVQDWDKATTYFEQIVREQPGFKKTEEKLQISRRQARLHKMRTKAESAMESGNWRSAESRYEKLLAEDPQDAQVASGLETAKVKREAADLYDEAMELHRASRWKAVLNILDQIHEIDPEFEDTADLYEAAERGHERQLQDQKLSGLYGEAVLAMEEGAWQEARRLLLQVQSIDPGYRETDRLIETIEEQVKPAKPEVPDKNGTSLVSETWTRLKDLPPSRRAAIGVLAGIAVVAIFLLDGGNADATDVVIEVPLPSATRPVPTATVAVKTSTTRPSAAQPKGVVTSTEQPVVVTATIDPYKAQGPCIQFAPPCTYSVNAGESFSAIAEKVYGSQRYTPVLLDYNRNSRGERPSLRVGDELFVPELTKLPALQYPLCGSGDFPCLYTAGPGDTYETIALDIYGSELLAREIEKANWDYDDVASELTAAVVNPGRTLVVPVP